MVSRIEQLIAENKDISQSWHYTKISTSVFYQLFKNPFVFLIHTEMPKLLDHFWSLPSCTWAFFFFWKLCAAFDVISIKCYQIALWVKHYAIFIEPAFVALMQPWLYSEYLIIQFQPKADQQNHSYQISQHVLNPFLFNLSLVEQLFWINEIISPHENGHSLRWPGFTTQSRKGFKRQLVLLSNARSKG